MLAGSYYQQIAVRTYTNAPPEYNNILDQFGVDANQMVENMLSLYTDVPLTGTAITKDINALANYWVAAKYYKYLHQVEMEKVWIDNYNEVLAQTIMRFKATPNDFTTGPISAYGSWQSEIITEEDASG